MSANLFYAPHVIPIIFIIVIPFHFLWVISVSDSSPHECGGVEKPYFIEIGVYCNLVGLLGWETFHLLSGFGCWSLRSWSFGVGSLRNNGLYLNLSSSAFWDKCQFIFLYDLISLGTSKTWIRLKIVFLIIFEDVFREIIQASFIHFTVNPFFL